MTDRRPWPWSLLVAEGVRTARADRWTSAMVVAVVAWVCAGIGAADAVDVSRAVRAEQAWIEAGAYVMRVQGAIRDDDRLPLPAAVCEQLSDVDGVSGAFWATPRSDASSFAHVPGGRFSMVDVSPGVWAFLDVDVPPVPAVVVSEGLARRTGVADGSPVRVGESDVVTARTSFVAVLGNDLDGALLVPSGPRERADACFIRTDASHVEGVAELARAALGWEGTDAVVSPRLHGDEFTVDFSRAHEERELRWAWVAGGAFMAVIWALILWFRRGQTAIYATFGVTTARRVVLRVAEWSVLAGPGLLAGWALGCLVALALGADARSALTQTSVQAMAAVSMASALVVLVSVRPAGTLIDQLKDR
ncbi:hypothetical protein [Cellulomonas sp. S1-8]|uniref:hypothetical protein n=1 Tax=Cellulomonas sp. S1-8 TaxID=2904790 RepID=UPI0022432B50|nr:hypothetical protein [Cellulomonas sp. S1-8]UZN04082.1 hypothetical protein OKX07_03875 [Cellulomonas sp. S1-8]